jgi:N-acetyl-anhydromuramyl-L-alanine amidase AmpD
MSHGDEQTDDAEDASGEFRQSEGGQIPEEPSPEPDRVQDILASDGEEIGAQATDGGVDGGIRELSEMREVTEMISDSFLHGPLPADKVRYIVMHDTESGTDSAEAIATSWSGGHIAAHFIVDKQGRVIQCVPIDAIAHHAGPADYGSNDRYGIWPERDDEIGRSGDGDYAMNAWSIGIEIVHEHYDGPYPEAQLDAVDRLVAEIDQAVGHSPEIIDHKAWAGGRKQDVSDDFPLSAYQRGRRHDG